MLSDVEKFESEMPLGHHTATRDRWAVAALLCAAQECRKVAAIELGITPLGRTGENTWTSLEKQRS